MAAAGTHLRVGGLRLLDGFVVLVARGDLAREVVVDAREPLGQDPKVVLDLGCEGTQQQRERRAEPSVSRVSCMSRVCACCRERKKRADGAAAARTLLLLILRDRPVDLLALLAQVLNA